MSAFRCSQSDATGSAEAPGCSIRAEINANDSENHRTFSLDIMMRSDNIIA
jgi:hypothetical protein